MLADKMGYGKTATTIGMLSEKPGQVPDERPSGYIRTGGAVCNIVYCILETCSNIIQLQIVANDSVN